MLDAIRCCATLLSRAVVVLRKSRGLGGGRDAIPLIAKRQRRRGRRTRRAAHNCASGRPGRVSRGGVDGTGVRLMPNCQCLFVPKRAWFLRVGGDDERGDVARQRKHFYDTTGLAQVLVNQDRSRARPRDSAIRAHATPWGAPAPARRQPTAQPSAISIRSAAWALSAAM